MNNLLYELTVGLFVKLCELTEILIDFLFTQINILGLKISIWQLLGGVGITTLLLAWLVKKVVPLT